MKHEMVDHVDIICTSFLTDNHRVCACACVCVCVREICHRKVPDMVRKGQENSGNLIFLDRVEILYLTVHFCSGPDLAGGRPGAQPGA